MSGDEYHDTNPFRNASNDLAERWDRMVLALETKTDEGERLNAENHYLRAEKDRLETELATRLGFFDLEIARVTARADTATEMHLELKARLDLISKTLLMVLNDTIKVRETVAPVAQPPQVETPVQRVAPPQQVQAPPPAPALEPPQAPVDPHEGRVIPSYLRQPTLRQVHVTEKDEEDTAEARALIQRLAPIALAR